MKRSCFVILCAAPFYLQAQTKTSVPELKKIGEAKSITAFIAGLSYRVANSDTSYMLTFNNARFSTKEDLQTVSFKNAPGILDSLYNKLNNALEMDNGKEIRFKLGNEDMLVTENRVMGTKVIDVMLIKNKAYFSIKKGQLMNLFNKEKQMPSFH